MFKNLLLIVFFIALSCEGQEIKVKNNMENKKAPYNIQYIGDDTYYDYKDLSKEIIDYGKQNLKNLNFQFPSYNMYIERIKKVFDIDITMYNDNIVVLNNSMFPDIAIKNERYVLFQTPNTNNEYEIDTVDLYHYNNYIFHNSVPSRNVLRVKNPSLLKDLIINYGYSEDKELLKWLFDNFNFDNENKVHDLVFDFNPETLKYVVRERIFENIEALVYGGKAEDFSYAKEGNAFLRMSSIINRILLNPDEYASPNKTIAYLFDRMLRVGIIGDIERYIDNNPNYRAELKKNNFYNLSHLKTYVEVIHEYKNFSIYFISDPDGYTNLRKEKNTSSDILQRIKSGEAVKVLDNSGDWYLVKTKEGKTGYIHKSRVKTSNEKPISANIDKKTSQFFIEEQEIKPSKSFIDKLLG